MARKTKNDYSNDWIEISYRIKMRDNWRCQECGLQFSPTEKRVRDANGKYKTLGVHHKDRNTLNNNPDNLITLCSACHCRAEWPLIRREMREKAHKDQLNLFEE